ncbi:MAG: S8 family serine peptidase [Bdellovibrionia bacterium]
MKKMIALLAFLITATVAHADGQRALVVLKSKETFKQVDVAFKRQGAATLKTFAARHSPLSQINVKIEDSLSNLSTLVVNVKSSEDLGKLMNSPEVALVDAEVFHPAPKPMAKPLNGGGFKAASKTPWGINAVKAPEAWADSKAGAGAKVLVLDTGIDKDHPALAPNFVKGQDFVGDNNGPYPFFDNNGHGTHVSGTIAGAKLPDGFVGVAPSAKIYTGRVCSNEGCSNVAIAKAINWGISENVDVISMSLGGMWSTPAERMAVSAADKAGIAVVAASGNNGSNKVSYPAALPTVVAVGAIDSDLKRADFSQYGPELAVVAPGVAVNSSVPVGAGRESEVKIIMNGRSQVVSSTTFMGGKVVTTPEINKLVAAGLGKVEEFKNIDVRGKFALISRGEIRFGEKVSNAMNAGAAGVVIYNNAPGLIQGAITDDGTTLPVGVFMIEQSVGEAIVSELKGGAEVQASLNIIPTDYSALDGTSMATPHVSGVVALMVGANPNASPAQIKDVLKRTATALGPNNNNEYGAGLVNAFEAVREIQK